MSARPDTDAVVLPEDVGGTGGVLIPEVQGDDGRAVCFVETAVDFHTGSMDDFLIKQACQSRFFFMQSFDALLHLHRVRPTPGAFERLRAEFDAPGRSEA